MPSLFGFGRRAEIDSTLTALQEEIASLKALEESRKTLIESPQAVKLSKGNAGSLTGGGSRDMSLLYDTFKGVPWISAPLDAIARRMTSGGWTLEPAVKGANPAGKKSIEDLLYFVNEDEDFTELCYLTILSLLIFGKSYWEIVAVNGKPLELYYVNPVPITEDTNEKGEIKGYVQVMDDGTKVKLSTDEILRFPLRGPLGETLSPIHKLLNSSVSYNYIQKWSQGFFRGGAKPLFMIELPEDSDTDDADRVRIWFEENYTGADNASKIPIMPGGAKLVPIVGHGGLEMDFLNTLKYLREEFLSVLGVPPSAISISDNGNRLSDMSDAQDKQFRFNTINPLRKLLEEKINYRILKNGFGVSEWRLRLLEEDYRSDESIIQMVVNKVNAGLVTRKEGRKQLGEEGNIPGAKGGDNVAAITYTRGVIPISDLPQIHSDQYQTAQGDAIQQGIDPKNSRPSDLAKASPRDPMTSGPQHPVSVQDDRFKQQGQVGGQAFDKKESDEEYEWAETAATADLAKWQRKALKYMREGKEQPLFNSNYIDPITYFAVTTNLQNAKTQEEIRQLFDQAFADTKEFFAA